MIISIIPEEEPIQEPGTVEEVPSEEETLEPESVISTYEQHPSPTVVEIPKKLKPKLARNLNLNQYMLLEPSALYGMELPPL